MPRYQHPTPYPGQGRPRYCPFCRTQKPVAGGVFVQHAVNGVMCPGGGKTPKKAAELAPTGAKP